MIGKSRKFARLSAFVQQDLSATRRVTSSSLDHVLVEQVFSVSIFVLWACLAFAISVSFGVKISYASFDIANLAINVA